MVGIRGIVLSTLLVLFQLSGNQVWAETHGGGSAASSGGSASGGSSGATGGNTGQTEETAEQKAEREAKEAQAVKDAEQLANALAALADPEDGRLLTSRTELQNRVDALKKELEEAKNAEKPDQQKIDALTKQIEAFEKQVKAIDAARSAIAREKEANEKMAKLAKELDVAQKAQAQTPQAESPPLETTHNGSTGGNTGGSTGTESVSVAPSTPGTPSRLGSGGGLGGGFAGAGVGPSRIPTSISDNRGGARQDAPTELVSQNAATNTFPNGFTGTPAVTVIPSSTTPTPTIAKDFNPTLEGGTREIQRTVASVPTETTTGGAVAGTPDPRGATNGLLMPVIAGVTGGVDSGGLVTGGNSAIPVSVPIESNVSVAREPDLGNTRGIYAPTIQVVTSGSDNFISGSSESTESFAPAPDRETVRSQGSYVSMPTASEDSSTGTTETGVANSTPGLIPGLQAVTLVATVTNPIAVASDPNVPLGSPYNNPTLTSSTPALVSASASISTAFELNRDNLTSLVGAPPERDFSEPDIPPVPRSGRAMKGTNSFSEFRRNPLAR